MSLYSVCNDCDDPNPYCLCFEITLKEGEGSFHIPFKKYERMYCNTKKNKSNTSIIIFQNFDITGKDKKRTVYRDNDTNSLYFKNFENKKRVYLIPEEFEDTREYLEFKEQQDRAKEKTSMAKNQMDMFEEQLDNFHTLNI